MNKSIKQFKISIGAWPTPLGRLLKAEKGAAAAAAGALLLPLPLARRRSAARAERARLADELADADFAQVGRARARAGTRLRAARLGQLVRQRRFAEFALVESGACFGRDGRRLILL